MYLGSRVTGNQGAAIYGSFLRLGRRFCCPRNYRPRRSLFGDDNLHAALVRLRDWRDSNSDYIHGLWLDALCINQENIPERSSEVRLMSRLYELARVVFGWLGPEEMTAPMPSI
jgi:hypothetical protein